MQADDRWVQRLQACIVDPKLFRLVAAQIVDDSIGFDDQRLQRFAAGLRFEIERNAVLAGIPALEIFAVRGAEQPRPGIARGIAPARGVFDLDDFSPEVSEKGGSVRTRTILFDRKDAQTFERLCATLFLLIHCFAMMMRCISLVPWPMHVRGASR